MVVNREDLPYRRCVGIAVFNAEGKVWAGRRLANNETGTSFVWQMPQGGIDKDEKPLLAAKRELFEETGIKTISKLGKTDGWLNYDLPDEAIGKALKGKYRGQTQKWFAFRFEGKEDEINITNPPEGSEPEFSEWAWRDLAEMPDLIVPFKRDVYRQVVEAFARFSS